MQKKLKQVDQQYYNDQATVTTQNDNAQSTATAVQATQAAASNTTKTPAPGYASANINTALQAAQNAEDTARHTWQSAQSQATQYDQEASALQKKLMLFLQV